LKLITSSNLKQYQNVLELAEYMVTEELKIFPDGNFHIYRDAPLLLTAKGTKAKIKRGMLKYWILPEGRLNKGTTYVLTGFVRCASDLLVR
jgi:hypothetical protein